MTPESTRKAFAELHDALRVLRDTVIEAWHLRQIADWIAARRDRVVL